MVPPNQIFLIKQLKIKHKHILDMYKILTKNNLLQDYQKSQKHTKLDDFLLLNKIIVVVCRFFKFTFFYILFFQILL